MDNLLHQILTEKIIGCAMKVHAHLGPGFVEVFYERAMAIELRRNDLTAETQKQMNVYYEDIPMGKRRLDMLVNNVILVELKAVPFMDSNWNTRIINYLKVFKIEVGLLLNFGMKSLQFKRFVNTCKKIES